MTAQNPWRDKAANSEASFLEGMQEVARTAGSQTAARLGRLLQTPIVLSNPHVSMLVASDVAMTVTNLSESELTICQGYIGGGIAGEALLTLNSTDPRQIAKLLRYEGDIDSTVLDELLTDTANLIIGAFLNGLGGQIDVPFTQSHPRKLNVNANRGNNARSEILGEMLAVETNGSIEGPSMRFSLLLLFTASSVQPLRRLVSYLQ